MNTRRSSLLFRSTILVSAACIAGAAASARGDTIYGLDSEGQWQMAAGNTRLAETFSTGSLRMTLDSVGVWVRNANEANNGSSAGTLTLSLYATDGDRKPTGSSLLTIGSQYFAGDYADEKPVFSGLNYTLSANSTYAVVFQGSADSTISWKYPASGSISTTISPTPTFRDWASSDNGASWGDAYPSVGFNMTVNASNTATPFTWSGGGSSNDWSDAANWSGGVPVSSSYAELVFAGSSRTANTNNLGNWRDVGRIQFASGAGPFTLGGDTIGFRPFMNSGEQQIVQNSANTQTIAINAFSFRNNTDSAIRLNAGDLVITSSDLYIDMNNDAWRTLYVTGDDQTRRTVTFAGNVNKGGAGRDPDIVIQNNKRMLVTGLLATGSGNDGAVFINSGVLEFSGSGGMTAGSPVVGDGAGSANAALLLGSAGASFGRQIEIKGGSSGQRIVGGANTSGTVTFSSNFVTTNSPTDYDLKAATGGAANFTGTRNFSAGLRVNRADTETHGGTVILSGTTSSSEWTAVYAGTLQFGDFNQLGSSHFEFDAPAGDSGTLRYTGGSTTTTKTLWIDNPGLTRAAIDVAQAGTTLTWNPGGGARNQNLTKTGAGTLVFAGGIGGGTVGVEAGNLVLTGSNSYTGATTVSGGRLSVNGSLGSTAVSVQSGGELGGSGSIDGTVAVLAGGTLSPGNSIESLAAGATTFSGASTFEYEYDSTNPGSLATAADLLVVNGDLTIGSGALITFTDLALSPQAFVKDTTIFALVDYSGTWNGGLFTYGSTVLADGGEFTVGSQQWKIDYDRTSSVGLDNFTGNYLPGSKFVVITAVPEPASAGLAIAGVCAAAAWRSIRRRNRA